MQGKTQQDAIMAKRGYLRPTAIAKKMGYAPSTVYRWIYQKKVRFIQGGRPPSYWIEKASLKTFLGPDLVELHGLQ